MSIPLGFLLGAVFYILEGLTTTVQRKRIRWFISDIFFFLLAGFVTYCFLLIRSKGEIRGYVLFGELIGFWIYKKLLSKLTVGILRWIICFIKSAFSAVSKAVSLTVCNMCSIFKRIFEKVNIFSKKGLKNQDELVYTETNNTKECE